MLGLANGRKGGHFMDQKKNLCAQIPVDLHAKVREEQEKSGLTLGAYITQLLTNFYEGGTKMADSGTRTLAFQISEELFQRIKNHLARESTRTGKKVSQREFVLGLIEQALEQAEREHGEQQ